MLLYWRILKNNNKVILMAKTIKLDTASKRYAYALYSTAEESKKIDIIKQQFNEINNGFNENPLWKSISAKPSIDHNLKAEVFLNCLAKFNLDPILKSFINVLIQRKRGVFLSQIYKEFINIYNFKHKVESIEVETATKLLVKEKKIIANFIKKQDSSIIDVQINEIINTDLISGFKFMFDSKVYDSSMQNKLARLKNTLL